MNLLGTRTKLINYVRGRLRTHAMVLTRRSPETFPALVRAALLSHPDGLAQHLERVLLTLETLNEQIKLADKELLSIAEQDPVCQRLMTVPGVGPVIAIRFVAVVDQPGRFHSAHHLMWKQSRASAGFRPRIAPATVVPDLAKTLSQSSAAPRSPTRVFTRPLPTRQLECVRSGPGRRGCRCRRRQRRQANHGVYRDQPLRLMCGR
jgi:hypothetical protein